MPPKKTPAPSTTPAPEPETAEQSAIASPEPGFIELRLEPGRRDIGVWISNRKVYGSTNVQGTLSRLGGLIQQWAYHPERLPAHITLLHARVEGLPTEEEWEDFDNMRRARAAAANAPAQETAEVDPPAGSEGSDG